MKPRLTLWPKVLIAMSSAGLTITGLVAYAFWIHAHPPTYDFFHASPRSEVQFVATIQGKPLVVRQKYNAWGMLGEEPPVRTKDSYWILAVGGSTTHGIFHNVGRDWPAQLQTRLQTRSPKIWVGNAGIPGYSTKGQKMFMTQFAPRIRPQMVLFLVGFNDLTAALQSDRAIPLNVTPRTSWMYWYLLLRTRLRETYLPWMTSKNPIQADPILLGNWETPLTSVDPRYPIDKLNKAKLIESYRANLLDLIQMCHDQNIQPIFLTQPMLYENSARWRTLRGLNCAVQGYKGYIDAAEYAGLLQFFNETLIETGRIHDIPVCDLSLAIPHDPHYYADVVHFTEEGAERIAARVDECLKSNQVLPFK